jgi:prefoldin subunit 5
MRRLSDERGLAGKILVGVVAWALGAVLLLTSTLVSAQQIDNRVVRITTEVSPIDKDLDSVNLAIQTNATAKEILAAAKPLTGQVETVVQATNGINASATSINESVASIHGAVDSINARAQGINSDVLSINGSVRAINGTAKSINATVRSIDGNVASIGASVHGIDGNLKGVLQTAQSIRGDHEVASGYGEGLAGINRRADAARAAVEGIKADTGNILALVRSIDQSAKSIKTKLP